MDNFWQNSEKCEQKKSSIHLKVAQTQYKKLILQDNEFLD